MKQRIEPIQYIILFNNMDKWAICTFEAKNDALKYRLSWI